MHTNNYSPNFFAHLAQGKASYKKILRPLIEALRPQSVVDFGAGAGTWLAAAKDLGVERVLGIDGPWSQGRHRLVEENEFREVNLEDALPNVGRFDLAISLEVLEHITPAAGERAVQWLCDRADVVLFSAAVPGQGGVHHINEAWQSAWARQFAAQGLLAFDIVRPAVWREPDIPWWYRQNAVVYARPELGARFGWQASDPAALDVVHPEMYGPRMAALARLRNRSLNGRLRALRGLFARRGSMAS